MYYILEGLKLQIGVKSRQIISRAILLLEILKTKFSSFSLPQYTTNIPSMIRHHFEPYSRKPFSLTLSLQPPSSIIRVITSRPPSRWKKLSHFDTKELVISVCVPLQGTLFSLPHILNVGDIYSVILQTVASYGYIVRSEGATFPQQKIH